MLLGYAKVFPKGKDQTPNIKHIKHALKNPYFKGGIVPSPCIEGMHP
jgi:hypothetical protein